MRVLVRAQSGPGCFRKGARFALAVRETEDNARVQYYSTLRELQQVYDSIGRAASAIGGEECLGEQDRNQVNSSFERAKGCFEVQDGRVVGYDHRCLENAMIDILDYTRGYRTTRATDVLDAFLAQLGKQ